MKSDMTASNDAGSSSRCVTSATRKRPSGMRSRARSICTARQVDARVAVPFGHGSRRGTSTAAAEIEDVGLAVETRQQFLDPLQFRLSNVAAHSA